MCICIDVFQHLIWSFYFRFRMGNDRKEVECTVCSERLQVKSKADLQRHWERKHKVRLDRGETPSSRIQRWPRGSKRRSQPSLSSPSEIVEIKMWICIPKYWFTLFCRENFLSQIYALFGVPFTGLKNMVAYQKWQLSGMLTSYQKLVKSPAHHSKV